jgi:hypothetical protein
MPRCDKGHEAAEVKSAIVDSKFGHYCELHIKGTFRSAGGHAAQTHRDHDLQDHRRDIIQAWNDKGEPNEEFIRNYPEEAAEMFDQEVIEKFGR